MTSLPRTVSALVEEWGLVVDGPPVPAVSSVVAPVTSDGVPHVLKVAHPRAGGGHEVLALQTWHGRGAPLLVRADPRRSAMLLERLHDRDLGGVPVLEACEAVAGVMARLHVPAPPQLDLLVDRVHRWVDTLASLPRGAAVPHRVVEQAVHVGRALASDPASTGVLLHGNLRYDNVLAGGRLPWLAVGPRPVSGDPHHEVAPLLWDRWPEVLATGDVRTAVRRRFHTVVDAAGLEEARARDWVVLGEAVAAVAAVGRGDTDRVTTAVAVVKAVQD